MYHYAHSTHAFYPSCSRSAKETMDPVRDVIQLKHYSTVTEVKRTCSDSALHYSSTTIQTASIS
jgi:hypothetical protein